MSAPIIVDCPICNQEANEVMEHGKIAESEPHVHHATISPPVPSPTVSPICVYDAADVVVDRLMAEDRLAKIRKHHRRILRMQNDLAMMASAAQMPKRAREEMEEEIFGDEMCSDSTDSDEYGEEEAEEHTWDANTEGRHVCKPLPPPPLP